VHVLIMMMDNLSQLTLLHCAKFVNRHHRTDQPTNQGHVSASVEWFLSNHLNLPVNDRESDAELELMFDVHMHQDELSEVCDKVTNDSEPVLLWLILAYVTQSNRDVVISYLSLC